MDSKFEKVIGVNLVEKDGYLNWTAGLTANYKRYDEWFAVEKYGFDEAHRLAVECRAKMESDHADEMLKAMNQVSNERQFKARKSNVIPFINGVYITHQNDNYGYMANFNNLEKFFSIKEHNNNIKNAYYAAVKQISQWRLAEKQAV